MKHIFPKIKLLHGHSGPLDYGVMLGFYGYVAGALIIAAIAIVWGVNHLVSALSHSH